MNNTIEVFAFPVIDLPEFFIEFFGKHFSFEESYSDKVIQKHLTPYLDSLKDNLHVVVEAPYVDKMYRDTFYNYYASKLKLYERDSIRISFFYKEVTLEQFRGAKHLDTLRDLYAGFLVIRPTFPRIIGRSAIAPAAFKRNSFVCCKAEINVTVNSQKFKVKAFPHSSQDNQTITCAETTIWSLMEYFGNKYVEYKPILPSVIHKILQAFSYKRQVPSEGLTAEQLTYAVRELGFGSMIFSKSKHLDFHAIVSVFIESGIPVIGVLKNDAFAHAVNIIGREVDDVDTLIADMELEEGVGDLTLYDYNKIPRNYVFIDDNQPPYSISSLSDPCSHYSQKEWQDCSLTNIIVPLYHRVYLDPIRARKNFLAILKNKDMKFMDTDPVIIRIFLASSRSYKEYISLEDLPIDTKDCILTTAMPKFIWVCEISLLDDFKKQKLTGVLLQDATEVADFSDQTNLSEIPVFFGVYKERLFTYSSHRFNFFATFAQSFSIYKSNLH